eukprot:scaffold72796_cov31-Phaeocystis_antarctica.AAC.1
MTHPFHRSTPAKCGRLHPCGRAVASRCSNRRKHRLPSGPAFRPAFRKAFARAPIPRSTRLRVWGRGE